MHYVIVKYSAIFHFSNIKSKLHSVKVQSANNSQIFLLLSVTYFVKTTYFVQICIITWATVTVTVIMTVTVSVTVQQAAEQ